MKIKQTENVYKLKSEDKDQLCIPEGSTMAKMVDTGNGYIFKFPAHSSVYQDNFLCFDYAEAEYIYHLLSQVKESFEPL